MASGIKGRTFQQASAQACLSSTCERQSKVNSCESMGLRCTRMIAAIIHANPLISLHAAARL